jgi:hypothetical protein
MWKILKRTLIRRLRKPFKRFERFKQFKRLKPRIVSYGR